MPPVNQGLFTLEFPQSLGVYDDYATAQKGAASGAWLGVFVGLLLSLFSSESTLLQSVVGGLGIGIVFGVVWALLGYAATRGRRDFSSVSSVVATKYEVLVEHKHRARAQELIADLPEARQNPFA